MASAKMRWALGVLAIALWAGAPYLLGQQPAAKGSAHLARRSANSGRRNSRHHRPAASPAKKAATRQDNGSAVSRGGAAPAARRVPEAGMPTLENPQPTGTLDTLPNQTLTPGATTLPGNAGGIAPASNDASSGDYTPSEGKTAPTTPGGNPSNTQGVPTFSSAAQPLDANLPRTVFPIPANEGTAGSAGKHRQKPQ